MPFISKCTKGAVLALSLFIVLGTLAAGAFSVADKFLVSKTYNIQYVNYNNRNDVDIGFEAYLKRKNVKAKITYHHIERSPAKMKEALAAIDADPSVDLIVTWGTTVTLGVFGTLKEPTRVNKPGVFVLVTSPIVSGIVASNAEPGRNITGSWHVPPISNQLRSMLTYKKTQKIGILYTPSELNSLIAVRELKRQATLISVEVVAIPFDFVDGMPDSRNTLAALKELKAQGAEWLYLPPDSYLGSQAKTLVIPSARALGIPTFASTEQLMLAGATVGLIAPYFKLGELTGYKAEQILVYGKKPATIAVTTIDRFEHTVNLEYAAVVGIDIDLNSSMYEGVRAIVVP